MNLNNKHLLSMFCILFLNTTIFADDVERYLRADQYFSEQMYKKAYPLLVEEAKKGSKPAMYRLGYMFQNGLGVERSDKKAAYWFQQSAAQYEYTINMESKAERESKTLGERISDQMEPSTNKEGAEYALLKMDTKTPETEKIMSSLIDGNFFGLEPYKENFILPISYASNKYPRISAGTHYNNYTPEQKKYDQYDKNTETEFQISLKKRLTYNLFGFNEYITFAYTQKVWWQLYADSAPFRETNYLPELFMSVPSSQNIDDKYGLKVMKYGFIHESNGQEGYRSRSWNRLYTTANWQWDNIFLSTRIWYRIAEDEKYDGYYEGKVNLVTGLEHPNYDGDDNPNMYKYMGYGDIKLSYLYNKHQFNSLFRYNFGAGGMNRGAIDASWSYPFFNSENTFWYVKFFSGYGESLIDYDRSVTKTSFGFSFSRGLF